MFFVATLDVKMSIKKSRDVKVEGNINLKSLEINQNYILEKYQATQSSFKSSSKGSFGEKTFGTQESKIIQVGNSILPLINEEEKKMNS